MVRTVYAAGKCLAPALSICLKAEVGTKQAGNTCMTGGGCDSMGRQCLGEVGSLDVRRSKASQGIGADKASEEQNVGLRPATNGRSVRT